jgi:DNA-binding response OmpR family regulator/chromosome segregation ATPase
MSTKVLVFESEHAFAEELRDGLSRFGCETTVVDDANVGLQAAANEKPDLILLSIELPRMNGFSVCNKLKRNAELKQVPLIIMSSDSTEETFEQHRRLRTRAEDYVHKPITFGELLTHIREFIPLTAEMNEVAVSEDAIVIDDDLEIEEDEIDAEVEDFAEQAFDALIDESSTATSVTPEAQLPAEAQPEVEHGAEPRAVEPGPESVEMDEIQLDEAEIHESRAPAAVGPEPSVGTAGNEADRARVRQLEEELLVAQAQAAELERYVQRANTQETELRQLREELEQARSKSQAVPSVRPGSSAREFLDLREALNKKDKEILELRDQLTHKERELLAVKDSGLALEREKADLDDQILELEKQRLEHQRQTEALRADKDQAAKRADDFKRKAERFQEELEARAKEIANQKQAHEDELARRIAVEANLRVEQQQTLEQVREQARHEAEQAIAEAKQAVQAQLAEAVEAARAAATGERERALAEREKELKSEFDAKIVALHRANEDAMNKLRAEHEQGAREAEEQQARLTSELASANEALANLHKQKEESEAARDAKIASLESELNERTAQRDEARRLAEQHDAKLLSLEAELASSREEVAAASATLSATQARLDKALSKWNEDRASLEMAKDALAAALEKIEEAEQRSIE